MNNLLKVLMERDGLTKQQAVDLCMTFNDEDDPEEFLLEELGLEPDYVFDFLDVVAMHNSKSSFV